MPEATRPEKGMRGQRKVAGRPIKGALEGEKATLGIRASADLKTRLMEAATRNGRSLSAEAEIRLEQSFRDQEIIERTFALAYGEKLAAILLTIGAVLNVGGPHWQFMSTRKLEDDWLSNPYAFNQAVEAVGRILEAMRPSGDLTSPASDDEQVGEIMKNSGKIWANGALSVIAGVPGLDEYERALAPVKMMLGPMAANARNFLARIGFFKKASEQ